ncbi:MAG: hypothetical protein KGH91_03660 [Rhodospirillales bacterium]|nr:hypothetical protein [Rhodospirillales bacterium]
MRKIWMASAALLMTSGVALAQTNSMSSGASSPAPTGAVNAPVETQPGQSPGNTAPNNMAPDDQSSGGMSSSGMAPNSASGSSGGMTDSTSQNEMSTNSGARTYLHMAQHAIEHHEKTRAESALGHAETRLLTRSVDAGSSMSMDQSPAVKAIEDARNALSSGDYSTASQDTSNALQQLDSPNNMSSDSGMTNDSGMSSNNGMSSNTGVYQGDGANQNGGGDNDTGNMAPSVNTMSRPGMTSGGVVTHDAPAPSSGSMQNTSGMSHNSATGLTPSPNGSAAP